MRYHTLVFFRMSLKFRKIRELYNIYIISPYQFLEIKKEILITQYRTAFWIPWDVKVFATEVIFGMQFSIVNPCFSQNNLTNPMIIIIQHIRVSCTYLPAALNAFAWESIYMYQKMSASIRSTVFSAIFTTFERVQNDTLSLYKYSIFNGNKR